MVRMPSMSHYDPHSIKTILKLYSFPLLVAGIIGFQSSSTEDSRTIFQSGVVYELLIKTTQE